MAERRKEEFVLGRHSYWWRMSDGTYEGPYCMTCYEEEPTKPKMVHLRQLDRDSGSYECPRGHGIWDDVSSP